jgi:hypothetical protein
MVIYEEEDLPELPPDDDEEEALSERLETLKVR